MYISKTTACCLSVKLLLCAGVRVHTRVRVDIAVLTDCAALDLELEFASRWELLAVGRGWFIPSPAPLSSHCALTEAAPLVLQFLLFKRFGISRRPQLCKRFCLVRYLREGPSFCFFSCFPPPPPPLSSDSLRVAGFNVCGGSKRGSASLISSSCHIISYASLKQ